MTKKPKIARTRATGELHTNLAEMADTFVAHQLDRCLMMFGSYGVNTTHAQAAIELRNQIYNALFKFHLKLERMA